MHIKTIGPNQTELHNDSGSVIFFSYDTPVAAQLASGGFVRTKQFHSVTTSRHINKWLDGRKAEQIEQELFKQLA